MLPGAVFTHDSIHSAKFISNPERPLREMCRVLRPGGRAVVALSDTAKAPLEDTHESGTADA